MRQPIATVVWVAMSEPEAYCATIKIAAFLDPSYEKGLQSIKLQLNITHI